jgi:hypothetical protein
MYSDLSDGFLSKFNRCPFFVVNYSFTLVTRAKSLASNPSIVAFVGKSSITYTMSHMKESIFM